MTDMLYLISYDIRTSRSEDYQDLYDELERIGAERILRSQWVVRRKNTNADRLCKRLLRHLPGPNDRLLIVCLDDTTAWASVNTIVELDVL